MLENALSASAGPSRQFQLASVLFKLISFLFDQAPRLRASGADVERWIRRIMSQVRTEDSGASVSVE